MALLMTLGLGGCFNAQDPDTFKCKIGELDCPNGYECDQVKWECVKKVTASDARLDGPAADAGDGMTADRGSDGPGDDKRVADKAVSDKAVSDKGVPLAPKWVTIKAGTFKMGSPGNEACRNPDETQHQVTLTSDFEIQNVEVTQAQFKAALGYNPSKFTACGTGCPVEQVTWHEAAAYCNALSAKQGLASCYTCVGSGPTIVCQEADAFTAGGIYGCPGYRLPTEAEWEYAYRAGSTSPLYNGSITSCTGTDATASKIGWYDKISGKTTHPVGQKTANKHGLYDMAGNVWEWCNDWHLSATSTSAVTDPWGAKISAWREERGGSWNNAAAGLRAANRAKNKPTARHDHIGFRPVRTLPRKPVVHWTLDDGGGITAKDSGKGIHNGVITNANWVDGVTGKALRFDGIKAKVLPSTYKPVWKSTDSFTLSVWAKPKHTGLVQLTMLGYENISIGQVSLFFSAKGAVGFYLRDGKKTIAYASGKDRYLDGRWHLVTGVRDAKAKKLRLYVDGVLDKEVTDTLTGTINASKLMPLTIGANAYTNTFKHFFKGDLDDVRVYDSALSAGQVKLLFNSAPSCGDKIKNGHEADVDCGGPRCKKCADSKKCTAPSDCLSGVCTNKACAKGCAHQPVSTDCHKDAAGVEWCQVPGGCFQMGSSTGEKCHGGNETLHQVTLSGSFVVQRTEATQAQYKAALGFNLRHFGNCGATCPEERVSWKRAAAYCNALSTKAGLAQCYTCTGGGSTISCDEAAAYAGAKIYSCPGFRLPTEAEWEYAYRAGSTGAYYTGANLACNGKDANASNIAWYKENSDASYAGCETDGTRCIGPQPVGNKAANAWGLYDMAGNVWEWCNDWYTTSYGTSPKLDPWGKAKGTQRVLRSGGFNSPAQHMRAASRFSQPPSNFNQSMGVRCVRSLTP